MLCTQKWAFVTLRCCLLLFTEWEDNNLNFRTGKGPKGLNLIPPLILTLPVSASESEHFLKTFPNSSNTDRTFGTEYSRSTQTVSDETKCCGVQTEISLES